MGFCRTNFFKRMDSSGLSFLISLYRHILRNTVFIYAIDNQLPLPIGVESDFSDELLDDEDIENQMFDENQIQLIKIKDKSQFFFSSSSDDYQSMAENIITLSPLLHIMPNGLIAVFQSQSETISYCRQQVAASNH